MYIDHDFYRKQFLWSKNYMNYDMEMLDEESVVKLQKFCKKDTKTILELGAGNGQFAVAAAKKGYEVTVIEVVRDCVEHIYKLKQKYNVSDKNLRIIEGDFYEVHLHEQFDVVCYWDGFGIGTDKEQRVLLRNIAKWLKPGREALIDVYTPWYWAKTAGQKMNFSKINRKYDFNAQECRMTDTWWLEDDKNNSITQSLRCYSPADLTLLLIGLNLQFVHCEPGGAMNYENWEYHKKVPLQEAMMFMAKLEKK